MTKPEVDGLIVVFTLGQFHSDQYGCRFVQQIRQPDASRGIRIIGAINIGTGNVCAELAPDPAKGDDPESPRNGKPSLQQQVRVILGKIVPHGVARQRD